MPPEEQNERNKREAAKASVEDVETIAVEKETVVDACQHNAKNNPGMGDKACFVIEPPAEGVVEPEIKYFESDPADIPSQTNDIEVRPETFVPRSKTMLQAFPDEESVASELGDDTTEAEIDEEHESRVADWRERVRGNLADRVELTLGPSFSTANVEYR